ncbi:MAG: hypothetical protein Q4D36_11635 [Bacteroidales bacterium]|nr:hypothetical protein [Bacteroidales bacterium]
MNFVIKYIRSGWLAVLIGIVTTSCTQDSADTVSVDEEKMLSIGFNVPTRNVYPYPTESGVNYENYIDWREGRYKIYFFDTDNKFIAPFKPNKIESRSGNEDYSVTYEAVGEIPRALVKDGKLEDFKIVVLANWPQTAYPKDEDLIVGETSIDNICNASTATFDCLTNFQLSETRVIPFYGVEEYTDVKFIPGLITALEKEVKLLRAMAKVEVMLDSSMPDNVQDKWKDLAFSDVKIHRYNAEGYCAPSGVYDGLNYPDEQESPELHLVNGANDSNDKSLSFYYKESENKWVAYLPEYNNQGENDYSYIEVKFNYQLTDDQDTYKIYFAEYKDATTPTRSNINLIRNNIYRFTVQKDGFKLLLTVSDWEALYENNFEYGDRQFTTPVAPWDDEINNEVEF